MYSCGAPGHGKSPFDGIGGRWKNKIDQFMSTTERKKLEFTDTGYIENVSDVFKALDCHFGRSEKKRFTARRKEPNWTLQVFLLFD